MSWNPEWLRRRDVTYWRIVMRLDRVPLIGVASVFWSHVVDEGFYGALDALAFSYLGDYLFDGRPVTESYFRSWYSRIPWPRRLHLHRAPCSVLRCEDHPHDRKDTPCTR